MCSTHSDGEGVDRVWKLSCRWEQECVQTAQWGWHYFAIFILIVIWDYVEDVTWHTCCLFLVLKAALLWSDVIFWIYQSALLVPTLVFTHLLVMSTLWLFKTISTQPLHCRRTFAGISKYQDISHRLHKEEVGGKELGLDPYHPHPDVLYILTKWERLLHNLCK